MATNSEDGHTIWPKKWKSTDIEPRRVVIEVMLRVQQQLNGKSMEDPSTLSWQAMFVFSVVWQQEDFWLQEPSDPIICNYASLLDEIHWALSQIWWPIVGNAAIIITPMEGHFPTCERNIPEETNIWNHDKKLQIRHREHSSFIAPWDNVLLSCQARLKPLPPIWILYVYGCVWAV